MRTRTKKTLTTAALGLAAVAASAGSASAADLIRANGAPLGHLPVGPAANLVPGAAGSTAGVQQAVSNGTSALPTNGLLPSGNQLPGGQVGGLLGGLPAGGGVVGG